MDTKELTLWAEYVNLVLAFRKVLAERTEPADISMDDMRKLGDYLRRASEIRKLLPDSDLPGLFPPSKRVCK